MRISDWSSDVCSSDLQPLDGEPVLRQVDAIERAVVALAVLQVIEDLQGGAERVGGGVVGRMLAVQVEQVAADGIGREAAVAQELAPVRVAPLHRILLDGGDEVAAAPGRDAGFRPNDDRQSGGRGK